MLHGVSVLVEPERIRVVLVALVPGARGLVKPYGPTGVAAGLAVVPVAAQVDLQS